MTIAIKTLQIDSLPVRIYDTQANLAREVARVAHEHLTDVLARKGSGTFGPGQPPGAPPESLSVPRLAFSALTAGASSATWVPTIVVTVPSSAVVGSYHGTITHSVA